MARHPYRIFTSYYYQNHLLAPSLYRFHSHPQYEIYYFHGGGRCEYLLGDRIIPLQAGDLIIMNGLTRHCPRLGRSPEYIRTTFSFDPHIVQLYGPDLLACEPLKPFELLRNHHMRLAPEAKAECEELLRRLDRFCHPNDLFQRNRLLAAFYELLMFIGEQCRDEMEHAKQSATNRERYVQSMIDYIEERYTEDVELERMASDLHMNRFHLMKVFREGTGQTVFDYLYKRRIGQAKILFYHSDAHSVAEVGYQVGFKHPSHFSRVFKKQVGMTPDQYRKLVHESSRTAYP